MSSASARSYMHSRVFALAVVAKCLAGLLIGLSSSGCAKDRSAGLDGAGGSFGDRPEWADRAPEYDGYGSSAGVKDIGPRVATYRFGRDRSGKVDLDRRTTGALRAGAKTLLRTDTSATEGEVDGASAEKLFNEHQIHLANPASTGNNGEGAVFQKWSTEKAFLFYKTVENLPPSINSDQGVVSVFYLSAKKEAAEITELEPQAISESGAATRDFKKVRFYKVSGDAFEYGDLASLFGNTALKARFVDNDFFKRYVKLFLYDLSKLQTLVSKRYGYETRPDRAAGARYFYDEFKVEELLLIIGLLEDLPPFFKPIFGIGGLFRRHNADGAGGCRGIKLENGAIEFYLKAFFDVSAQEFHLLLVTELARAWSRYTLEQNKLIEWRKLSGWAQDGAGRWTPSITSNMVSDGAAKDPENDFAESVAAYVVDPNVLLSRAKEKYDFIFSLMDGYQYRITARDEHRFQVVSATPDLSAPVADVTSLEVDTHVNADGYYTVKVRMDVSDDISGVAGGSIEVFSDLYPNHKARGYFMPTGRGKKEMEAVLTISRFSEKGKWNLAAMRFTDNVRNVARYTSENMGWDLTLPDNGYAVDKEAPKVDRETLELKTFWNGETRMHEIYAEASVSDNLSDRLFGTLSAAIDGDYGWSEFRGFEPAKGKMYFMIPIGEFQKSGKWRLYYLSVKDELCNGVEVYFDDGRGKQYPFEIANQDWDSTAPTIRVDGVQVEASERDPATHDGGYDVLVRVPVSDDLSGVRYVSVTLMGPTGKLWSGSAAISEEAIRKDVEAAKPKKPRAGWGSGAKPAPSASTSSGSEKEVTVEVSISLPAHVEGGEYIVSSVNAMDAARNFAYEDLTTRAIAVSF